MSRRRTGTRTTPPPPRRRGGSARCARRRARTRTAGSGRSAGGTTRSRRRSRRGRRRRRRRSDTPRARERGARCRSRRRARDPRDAGRTARPGARGTRRRPRRSRPRPRTAAAAAGRAARHGPRRGRARRARAGAWRCARGAPTAWPRGGPYNRGPMTPSHRPPEPDRPWMMRTYAGHSSATASNALYRSNLAKGQTGLSVAFDLPRQTGYDPDHELARGEVGKVGRAVAHKGDMHTLIDGIPLDAMNTSMTINATAAWLLALYIVVAEDDGIDQAALQGTTQNDIIKEFLARGTYAFPPGPSMRLIADMVAYTVEHVPRWNPVNICSYHLQEAGATPVQEVAFSLANAIAVLDAVRERVGDDVMPRVFGRISFFVNAGVRFVEENAKLRAMATMWERLGRDRYGVTDERHLRFRYGVQVNSLGLTESQPENNVQRIVLEGLAVTLGRDARARSVQLPAWNEALGLPRPWDQQW